MREWNPNYVAYARRHGKTPEAMLESDRKRWPGGLMCGFILWIMQEKTRFFKAAPEHFLYGDKDTIWHFDEWGKWLREKSIALQPGS